MGISAWIHRPSVWRYFLGRYGMEDDDIETAEHTLEEIRKKNKEQFTIDEEYFLDPKKEVKAARERIKSQPGAGYSRGRWS